MRSVRLFEGGWSETLAALNAFKEELVSGVVLDTSAEKSMKDLRKTDSEAAERMQRLIDQVKAGVLPQGSCRMNNGKQIRRVFGAVPHKVACGKLRMIFIPNERIIALGYRRDVYNVIGHGSNWSN